MDRSARIWDAATGAAITELLPHDGPVWCAVFSPDGGRVATSGDLGVIKGVNDGIARIWDATHGNLLATFKHKDRIYTVAFSPDGARVVTASRDKTAQVWNLATGKPVPAPLRHNGAVRSAAFSPDGLKVVTASFDGTARVWFAATGEPATPFLLHKDAVRSAAFSADGARVVTASDDNSARVWDAASGLALTPPLRHDGAAWCAAFSPDGLRVVSGGKDNVARLWSIEPDTRPAAELQSLAELLTSERLDSADGLEYLTKEQWQANSQVLHQSMPREFHPTPSTQPGAMPTTVGTTRPSRNRSEAEDQ